MCDNINQNAPNNLACTALFVLVDHMNLCVSREGSVSRRGRFTPKKKAERTQWTGGCVGLNVLDIIRTLLSCFIIKGKESLYKPGQSLRATGG